jgi:hypothetical protein
VNYPPVNRAPSSTHLRDDNATAMATPPGACTTDGKGVRRWGAGGLPGGLPSREQLPEDVPGRGLEPPTLPCQVATDPFHSVSPRDEVRVCVCRMEPVLPRTQRVASQTRRRVDQWSGRWWTS